MNALLQLIEDELDCVVQDSTRLDFICKSAYEYQYLDKLIKENFDVNVKCENLTYVNEVWLKIKRVKDTK